MSHGEGAVRGAREKNKGYSKEYPLFLSLQDGMTPPVFFQICSRQIGICITPIQRILYLHLIQNDI